MDSGNRTPSFDEWLQQGYNLGYCGPPLCPDHDGIPMSFAEETILAADGEWCCHIVRLYEDARHKYAIERHHGPSVWRARNLGWNSTVEALRIVENLDDTE